MSTIRRQPARRLRDPEGRTVCSCGCGRHPAPPRKTWFSQACVDAWKLVNDPETIRRALLERDRGICAICGVDCNKAFGAWKRAAAEANRFVWKLIYGDRFQLDWNPATGRMEFRRQEPMTPRQESTRRAALLEKWMPPGNWTADRSSGWDADHIVPVVEGGGLCELTNMRTLCHPCHKAQTKALAERRAAARKPLPQPTLL